MPARSGRERRASLAADADRGAQTPKNSTNRLLISSFRAMSRYSAAVERHLESCSLRIYISPDPIK
jgi:hypothetical protein